MVKRVDCKGRLYLVEGLRKESVMISVEIERETEKGEILDVHQSHRSTGGRGMRALA